MIWKNSIIKSTGMLCLLTFFLITCQPSVTNSSKDFNYYLELYDSSTLHLADSLLPEITTQIQGKKYAITHQSQHKWPFFESFDPEFPVSRDSLLPPHTGAHYFLAAHSSTAKDGDYKVSIVFYPLQNNLYNFNQFLFQKRDGEWIQIVNTGNHKVTPKKQGDSNLAEVCAKIIIRYSFK